MKPLTTAALFVLLAASRLSAQTFTQIPVFTDPANLRGERVKPRDGRELPVDQGVLGLQQLLRRLNTRASLMLIVAHPDDEDSGMLTFYARGLGARVAMLTLNRGEGGQNAMTGDFEDALGLLRTQELLAEDRYSGVDQIFGTEVDFGFSKTKEEAFNKWGHQRVLYDAVRAVRLYRPMVIASVFIGGVTDGHGQHQVAGEIAQEVFKAAGDPKVFPELTAEGILPWQPMKVYARVPMQAITEKGLFDYATGQYTEPRFTNYVTGEVSTTPPTPDVVVHEGQSDPLLMVAAANPADVRDKAAKPTDPLSYVQFARIGLGLQKSQIGSGERRAPAGKYDVSYHRYGSMLGAKQKPEEESFFDGVDTSISGIADLAPRSFTVLRNGIGRLGTTLATAAGSFSAANPEVIAPVLADALGQANTLIGMVDAASRDLSPAAKDALLHELRVKRAQINDALALSLGLSFDATSLAADLNAGETVKLSCTIQTTASVPLSVQSIHAETAPRGFTEPEDVKIAERPLTAEHADRRTLTLSDEETGNVTRPYFVRESVEQPVYQLRTIALQGAPATPPAVVAWADVNYQGTTVSVGRVVHHGEQPAMFVPPLSLMLSANAQVLPDGDKSVQIGATVRANDEHDVPAGRLRLIAPAKWSIKPETVQPQNAPLLLGPSRFEVNLPRKQAAEPAFVQAEVLTDADPLKEGYRPVGYGDLPRTNFFTQARDKIVPVDMQLPAKRKIAYLAGTGDGVPDALASIGLAPAMLSVGDLTAAKLAQYDTVILGVRTYAAHPDLHGAPTQALLDYAKAGGNVVVQYQTTEFTAADAPYPLALGSNEKVVDETAPVQLLDPASPLLSAPNKITPQDFNGWIEERGHGFLATWDEHYAAPTETHDPGSTSELVAPQAPQRGGLMTTKLGKGRWTYVAFALYRQLPQAVPGAWRLFVNLLQPQ